MGIFRPQKYIFMSIKLFTIFSIKCYEESHKINEWKFSCDTTTILRDLELLQLYLWYYFILPMFLNLWGYIYANF